MLLRHFGRMADRRAQIWLKVFHYFAFRGNPNE
jgi:hypothetical protein